MIVWMASYPRSGNWLLFQAIHAIYGVRPRTVYPNSQDHYQYRLLGDTPGDTIFLKTHETGMHSESEHSAIVLVRDPRDAILFHSWFLQQYKHDPRGSVEIQAELARSGKWGRFYHEWVKRDAPVTMIRFEDMIDDLVGTVTSAVERLGVSLRPKSDPELPEIRPRAEIVGRWQSELYESTVEAIRRSNQRMMSVFGYPIQSAYAETYSGGLGI